MLSLLDEVCVQGAVRWPMSSGCLMLHGLCPQQHLGQCILAAASSQTLACAGNPSHEHQTHSLCNGALCRAVQPARVHHYTTQWQRRGEGRYMQRLCTRLYVCYLGGESSDHLRRCSRNASLTCPLPGSFPDQHPAAAALSQFSALRGCCSSCLPHDTR